MAMVWFKLAVRLLGEFTYDFQLVNLCINLNPKLLSKRLINDSIVHFLLYSPQRVCVCLLFLTRSSFLLGNQELLLY